MNQILSIISDIRVVIGIAVVVLILAVWLIVEKVRTKKFRKELEGLEKRYNAIKSIPLTFKMNKAVTAARSNADTANKVNEAKKSYDMTQASIRKISENLANCEDAILLGKLRKADDIMSELETDISLTTKEANDLDAYLNDILAKEMIKREKEGKGFNFFHFMIDLTGGPCVYKRLSGCGSGTEYLAVTPWGDFYPCHQFVGEEQYLMGNVDEGITKPEIVKDFGRCNVYTKPDCKDCFARFYCSGGCAANGYHFGGDIRGNYKIGCELQRKRVECAIMIKAALAE